MARPRIISYPTDPRQALVKRRRLIDEVSDRGEFGREGTARDRILTPYWGEDDAALSPGDPASDGGVKIALSELSSEVLTLLMSQAGELVLRQDFDFTASGPVDFGELVAGDIITRVVCVVSSVFDDAGAWLSLGTMASGPASLLAIGEAPLSGVQSFGNPAPFSVTAVDSVRLVVSPGASVQGDGYVLVWVRRG